jgi:hypothetical protein
LSFTFNIQLVSEPYVPLRERDLDACFLEGVPYGVVDDALHQGDLDLPQVYPYEQFEIQGAIAEFQKSCLGLRICKYIFQASCHTEERFPHKGRIAAVGNAYRDMDSYDVVRV